MAASSVFRAKKLRGSGKMAGRNSFLVQELIDGQQAYKKAAYENYHVFQPVVRFIFAGGQLSFFAAF